MEREKSWEQLKEKGNTLRKIWLELADKNNIEIELYGIKALSGFSFKSNNREYKTLITQEMLKKGFLASTSCYLSTSHNSNIFDLYANILDEVFQLISKCENGYDVKKLIKYPLCHIGFERLN